MSGDANDILRECGPEGGREWFDAAHAVKRPEKNGHAHIESSASLEGTYGVIQSHDAEQTGSRKTPDGAKRTQATVLLEIVTRPGVELFHTADGTPYADIVVDGHWETWQLASLGFRRWLRRAYYEKTGGAPNAEAMTQAMGVLEARAYYDGPERPVCLRVAEHDGCIYVDLCDAAWRAVEINTTGWRIVARPPVRFRRTRGMLALPEPVRGARIDELRRHLRFDNDGYVNAVAWLLGILRARGPYPILALTGEQGTGKSVTADMLRGLIDPHSAPLRSLPRDTRDLYVAAINGHVLVFDNLSGISAEVSDALCRLSTGGGFSTRALYTNDDELLFEGQRPIALTSIADVATRSDLADRSIIVQLEVIPDAERRTEVELRAAFDAARPRILGALLDTVAHGLMQLPQTRLSRPPRMADFAQWVAACETAMWTAGTHMAAYEVARAEAVDSVIEADTVAMELSRFIEARSEWSGTPAELLTELTKSAGDHLSRAKYWPTNPRGLSGQLKRLAPALRRVGITIDRKREANRRLIFIAKGSIHDLAS